MGTLQWDKYIYSVAQILHKLFFLCVCVCVCEEEKTLSLEAPGPDEKNDEHVHRSVCDEEKIQHFRWCF